LSHYVFHWLTSLKVPQPIRYNGWKVEWQQNSNATKTRSRKEGEKAYGNLSRVQRKTK